jgi:hypothetical protein
MLIYSFIIHYVMVKHGNLHDSQDFMIQGGDPTGTGRGGSSIYGYVVYNAKSTRCLVANAVPVVTNLKMKYILN